MAERKAGNTMRANGVSYYTWATAQVRFPFPNSDTYCDKCMYNTADGLRRPFCQLKKALIFDPYSRPEDCPIIELEEIRHGINDL